MSFLVTGNAVLKCTFGAASAIYMVAPTNKVQVDAYAANITNQTTLLNIPSFGLCRSPANPVVAAATAAALGVLTPMPCVPATVAPWTPGVSTVLIGNLAALDNKSKLTCCWGGCISIKSAGQSKVSFA
ncbi:DUF4280 domain-containing protein [Candidatus Methylospira mobilis]|uniref:DUF4280 domain-containing protein n=1 Tax=Candidatus Methylospira mobilis TaxID=1808979 RepID=A0A5Q0BBD0_9GAMM|nr:DUF4280 domain-containing protein [Candidatus Methylospira mobilis]QFY41263.1 DUF4280 domain-containing protein [Candidatus Methylospira mobilis]WNV05515.1 DUF4280 domain-containing protein [Candidatus Methylospira mobilis]